MTHDGTPGPLSDRIRSLLKREVAAAEQADGIGINGAADTISNLAAAWKAAILCEPQLMEPPKSVTFDEGKIFQSPGDLVILREVLTLQDLTHWPAHYRGSVEGMLERLEKIVAPTPPH